MFRTRFPIVVAALAAALAVAPARGADDNDE